MPDARVEQDIEAYARDVQTALGDQLLCVAVYGSAAGDDWVTGRSDVNTAVVVERVTTGALEALAPIVTRFRARGFALPLIVDRNFFQRAGDVFPMELDDIRRRHRVLAGTDVLATGEPDRAALRRECEREARSKLLRLRAHFLETADVPEALERLMLDSLKSFLVLLRHFLRLRGSATAYTYGEVLAAGEAALGPLPVMSQLFALRTGAVPAASSMRARFGAYLGEVERLVAALDALDA